MEEKLPFLDKAGVIRLWQHILAKIGVKADRSELDLRVPTARKVNNKELSADITLTASDVNAYSKDEIDNMELITTADIDTICNAIIYGASEVIL